MGVIGSWSCIAAAGLWVLYCIGQLLAGFPQASEVAAALRSIPWAELPSRGVWSALARHALVLLIAAVLALCWAGFGSRMINWVAQMRRIPGRLPVWLLCGFAVSATSVFALALCGLVFPAVLLLLLAVGAGLGVCSGAPLAWAIGGFVPLPGWRGPLILVLAPVAVVGSLVLAPDFNTDVYISHLAVVQQVVTCHKFTDLGTSMHFQFPLLAEMNYTVGYMVGSDVVPHVLQLVVAMAGLSVLVRWSSEQAGLAAGWMAFVAVVTSPHVWSLLSVAKNDMVCAAYLVAGAVLLAQRHAGSSGIAALFFGCAAATKQTGLVFAAVALGWVLVWRRGRGGVWWCVIAAIPVVPWALKSWMMMGDPFWPLLSGFVPGALWDSADALAISPIRHSDYLHDFAGAGPAAVKGLLMHSSIVALASATAICGCGGWNSGMAWLAGFSLAGGLMIHLAHPVHTIRYAIPLLILWSAVVAVGVVRVSRDWSLRVRSLGVWTLAAVALTAWPGYLAKNPVLDLQVRYMAGLITESGCVDLRMSTYVTAAKALGKLPEVRRVISEGEIRSYRMAGRHLGERCWGRSWGWVFSRECETPGRIAVRFHQLRCRHLLYNFVRDAFPHPETEPYRWDVRMLRLWKAFVGRYMEPVVLPDRIDNENGGFVIYSVRTVPLPRDPPWLPYLPGIKGRMYEVTRHGEHSDVRGWIAAARVLASQLPDVDSVRDLLALGLRLDGKWREAWGLYRVSVGHGILTGTNLWDAGVCAAQVGDVGEAQRLFRRCIEVSPYMRPMVDAALRDLAVPPPK